MRPLVGKVALVTGATRGIGKGIALQLGENGAKVYITGRTLKSKDGGVGSLEHTCEEIKKRGGTAIPVQVDHEKSDQIEDLFKKINSEQNGQLDVLVNNAYKGVTTIFDSIKSKFWQTDPSIWDDINNVGLRNHYFCSVYASRLMVPRKQGLIVNITSLGGQNYLFNTAYGIGKAALDRMSHDCGIELKKQNVACLSLMLGAVRTELVTTQFLNKESENLKLKSDPNQKNSMSVKKLFEEGETVEYGGKLIAHMAKNPNIMKYSSKIVISAEYGAKYGIVDIDGRKIPSHRELSSMGSFVLPKPLMFLARTAPFKSLKVPQSVLDIANSKIFRF